MTLSYVLLISSLTSAAANSTAYWHGRRSAMVQSIFGSSQLPSRSTPDYTYNPQNSPPGVMQKIWDISDPRFFPLNSTTFHYPINPAGARSESVMIHHHGHAQTCDNTVNGVLDCPVWFDFYNVSTFIHRTLGMDVTFMYMPLLGPNQQHGYPTKHQWFQSWESKGDHTMRYFVEPVVLTINHLLSLGYKNIFMMGKSGGGWTTTVAAAVDPRISASFPIAGSVPLDLRVGAYAHADIGDYEQKVQKPYNAKMPWYLDECNYRCQYVLAGLEPKRYSVQILHENDPCCYKGAGRHGAIMAYDANITAEIASPASRSGSSLHGEFTTAVTNWPVHAVCPLDKQVIAAALGRVFAATPTLPPNFAGLPCDMLRGGTTPCPGPPPPPSPAPPPPTPSHTGGCWRGATPPCVFVDSCDAAIEPQQLWSLENTRNVAANAAARKGGAVVDPVAAPTTVTEIVHTKDRLCLTSTCTQPSQGCVKGNETIVQHNQLTLAECDSEDQRQQWILDGSSIKSSLDQAYCLNVGAAEGERYLEFQLYTPCTAGGHGNGNGAFKIESDGTFRVDLGDYSNCISSCNAGDAACAAGSNSSSPLAAAATEQEAGDRRAIESGDAAVLKRGGAGHRSAHRPRAGAASAAGAAGAAGSGIDGRVDDYTVVANFNLTVGVVGDATGTGASTQAECESACNAASWGCTQWSWSCGHGGSAAKGTPTPSTCLLSNATNWAGVRAANVTSGCLPWVDECGNPPPAIP